MDIVSNQQAAEMSANQQAMKDQAAAVALAKTLGYTPEAVGVPTSIKITH